MQPRLLSVASLFLLVAVPAFADTFGTGANQFTIDFVTIGNPGNPADTTGVPNLAGSVPYVYRMGKYEISRDMVTQANAGGNLGITLEDMVAEGIPSGNGPNKPATGVSWNEAARFVNYLNTSQGYPAAYKFATQPGDSDYYPNADINLWEPSDPGYDPTNLFRNRQAHYFLPSVDEWYKSAFYDPNANGDAGRYWDYPTGSDHWPPPVASGTDPGTAVWNGLTGPADITQAGGLSPYGTMAQAGNVWELEETAWELANDDFGFARGLRGGDWANNGAAVLVSASHRDYDAPGIGLIDVGFRVAAVPEPSTAYLAAVSALILLRRRSRPSPDSVGSRFAS